MAVPERATLALPYLRRRRAFARRVARLRRSHRPDEIGVGRLFRFLSYSSSSSTRPKRVVVVVVRSFVRSFVRFNRPFRRIAPCVRRVTRSCGLGRSWTRASSATRERSRTIADCGKGNFPPSVLGRGGWSRARGGRRVATRLGLESAFV